MKKANQKNLLVAHLIIGFSAVASASCPNSTQQAAMKSRAVVNDIYVKADLCKQVMGNTELHRQYALLRNRNQAYFDRQSRLTEAFHQDETDSMYALQRSFNNNLRQGQGPAVCAETQRLLSELLSAGSEAELDRRIQAVTGVDAPTVAGCSSANTSSGSRPSNPSESGEGQPYGPISAESQSARGANLPGEDVAIERPSFQQEPNAGIGALKIIASLYVPANLADRCAPTQPSFFDVNGDFYSIYNSLPQESRPFYSQSQRNPVWNGSEMNLITSDCSSFVSSAIGAGGLKIKKNQEVNEIGNMPTTLDMLNWHTNPSSNNCFETVEFKRGEAAIQVGDIYVYGPTARHVEIITHVHSESDPLGFESQVNVDGETLPSDRKLTAADCSRPLSVIYKTGLGGNGFNKKLFSAQISDTSRGPYLGANQISGELLALACEAHFSGETQPAFVNVDGQKQGLFRIKRDADGNIPASCISQAEIVHKGYDSVRACFAPNASN